MQNFVAGMYNAIDDTLLRVAALLFSEVNHRKHNRFIIIIECHFAYHSDHLIVAPPVTLTFKLQISILVKFPADTLLILYFMIIVK